MTAYEALKGKKTTNPVCEFAEQVLFLPAKTVPHRNWLQGTFIGILRRSNEYLVAGPDGVAVRARTIRRMKPESRWSRSALDNIKGTPWAPVDGDREEEVPTVHIPKDVPVQDVPKPPEAPMPQIRRMKIPMSAYIKYGLDVCHGCRALRAGKPNKVVHTPECVKQVEAKLTEDPEWRRKFAKAYEEQTWKMARRLEQADEQ